MRGHADQLAGIDVFPAFPDGRCAAGKHIPPTRIGCLRHERIGKVDLAVIRQDIENVSCAEVSSCHMRIVLLDIADQILKHLCPELLRDNTEIEHERVGSLGIACIEAALPVQKGSVQRAACLRSQFPEVGMILFQHQDIRHLRQQHAVKIQIPRGDQPARRDTRHCTGAVAAAHAAADR